MQPQMAQRLQLLIILQRGGTLTFNPGDTTKTLNVAILADTVDEENETFTVALSSPTNAPVSTSSGTATMTITDDDAAPTISINDVTSAETAGVKNLVATISQPHRE